MTHRIFLIIVLFAIYACKSAAQVVVGGMVTDGDGPMKGVIIKAIADNKMLAYTVTNSAGKYTVRIPPSDKPLCLSAEHLGYEKQTKSIENRTQTCNFILHEKTQILKEVIVKASPITQRGDTLSYNVASFATESDYTLKDVLKKLPGIEVAKNGHIQYLGKDISQFYIEDVDLLGGKYNIATNNIPADYVSTVQVYNHHQPVKMNKDIFSDDVALNIKLSKKAKLKPVGTIEGLLGLSKEKTLYQFGGAGMLFTKKFQTIATVKVGNESSFAEREGLDHLASTQTHSLSEDILGSISASTPPLAADRYSYPRDQHYSLNSSLKLSDNKTLKMNAGYAYSHGHHSYGDVKAYYAGDTTIVIEQTKDYFATKKAPSFKLEYKNNSAKAYIVNSFSSNASFKTAELPTIRNALMTQQRQTLDAYNLSNELTANWRRGHWSINTSNVMQLSVSPNAQLDIKYNNQVVSQWMKSLNFSVAERISGTYIKNRARIYLPLALQYKRQNMRTSLEEDNQTAIGNSSVFDNYRLSFSPQYEYTAPSLNIRAALATHADYISHHDHNNNQDISHFTLSFCPEADISYKLTPRATITTKASYKRSLGDIRDFLLYPIRTDILTERLSMGELSDKKVLTAKVRFDYKFPISQWFFNMDCTYRNTKSNSITSQVVTDNMIAYVDVPRLHSADKFTSSVSAVKRFQSIGTKLSLSLQYSWSRQQVMQNASLIGTTSESLAIIPSVISKPFGFLEFSYEGQMRKASSKYLATRRSLWQQDHSLKFILSPWKTFLVHVGSDIAKRDISDDVSKTIVLFDCGLSYRQKAFKYSLNLNNIFNQRQYTYTEYSTVNTYTYQYNLRGREFLLAISYTL